MYATIDVTLVVFVNPIPFALSLFVWLVVIGYPKQYTPPSSSRKEAANADFATKA